MEFGRSTRYYESWARFHKRRFCSHRCAWNALRVERTEVRVCEGCGRDYRRGEVYAREAPSAFARRRFCSVPCSNKAQQLPDGVLSLNRARMDEAWEDRITLIEDGLLLGLTGEGIASDCGVTLESLVRQCKRRGRPDLEEALIKRRKVSFKERRRAA